MLHASGRFDRPILVRRRVARQQRKHSWLIVRTEQKAASVFRTLAWAVLRTPGRYAKGDVTIEHRRTKWQRLDGYAVLLSKVRYLSGRKKNWAVVGVYKARASKRLRVIIGIHMPARVESALRSGVSSAEARAWQESLVRLSAEIGHLRAKYPTARLDVVGDWNVAVENPYFRNLISAHLGGLTPATPIDEDGRRLLWKNVQGTHGARVIDWDWSTDEDATGLVRPLNPASDHHPISVD